MELPKRKHPRLKNYDYSLPGYYYVTIHVADPDTQLSIVGRGLAPTENRKLSTVECKITLTPPGEIAKRQLGALEKRFPWLRVDKYVIMPTHIHMILCFSMETAGACPRPTLSEVVGAYKSLTTRVINQTLGTAGKKRFQTSFYETVLRNEAAYLACWQYIDENPLKWFLEPEDR